MVVRAEQSLNSLFSHTYMHPNNGAAMNMTYLNDQQLVHIIIIACRYCRPLDWLSLCCCVNHSTGSGCRRHHRQRHHLRLVGGDHVGVLHVRVRGRAGC